MIPPTFFIFESSVFTNCIPAINVINGLNTPRDMQRYIFTQIFRLLECLDLGIHTSTFFVLPV